MDSFFTANLHATTVAANFRHNKHGWPRPEPLAKEDFFHEAPAEHTPLHLDDTRIESFMEIRSVRDSPYFFIYVLAHHRLAD